MNASDSTSNAKYFILFQLSRPIWCSNESSDKTPSTRSNLLDVFLTKKTHTILQYVCVLAKLLKSSPAHTDRQDIFSFLRKTEGRREQSYITIFHPMKWSIKSSHIQRDTCRLRWNVSRIDYVVISLSNETAIAWIGLSIFCCCSFSVHSHLNS